MDVGGGLRLINGSPLINAMIHSYLYVLNVEFGFLRQSRGFVSIPCPPEQAITGVY